MESENGKTGCQNSSLPCMYQWVAYAKAGCYQICFTRWALVFSSESGVFREACKNVFSINAELTEQETGASLKVV